MARTVHVFCTALSKAFALLLLGVVAAGGWESSKSVGAPATRPPKRVLILDSFGRDAAPFAAGIVTLRTTLARELGEPAAIYDQWLDMAQSADPEAEKAVADFLDSRFSSRKLDVVLPIGAPAIAFAVKYRDRLFPQTPMVFVGADERRLQPAFFDANTTLVSENVNLPAIVEGILEVLPETTNIVVVIGTTKLEKFWLEECKREFGIFTSRVGFTWLSDLSLDGIQAYVSHLPPRSAVFCPMLVVDGAGVPYEQAAATDALHKVAGAPVFGFYKSQLEAGIVGGRLFQDEEVGAEAARIAIRVLRGEKAGNIPHRLLEATAPTYDWRELHRWGIPESRLPAGSIVQFRKPSLWAEYKWQISAGTAVIIAQALMIAALLRQARRRKDSEARFRTVVTERQQVEEAAREVSGRLITAQEDERRRIARDLHDDLNQRLAMLSVEMELYGQSHPENGHPDGRLEQMATQVKDLSSEVHKLAYQLHPAKLDQLGLVSAARGFCRELSEQTSLRINFSHEAIPRELPAQVALPLYRVIQESLRNVVRHSGASAAQVQLQGDMNEIRLKVTDNGRGFDTAHAVQNGGLGLVGMRERIRLLEGTISVHSETGQGTTVELSVPVGDRVRPAPPESAINL